MNIRIFYILSVIYKVTRPEGKSCIDHIFIETYQNENQLKNIHEYILNYLLTDYFPIILTINFLVEVSTCKTEEIKIKTHMNYKNLRRDVQNESRSDMYMEKNVDTMIVIHINTLKNIYSTTPILLNLKTMK